MFALFAGLPVGPLHAIGGKHPQAVQPDADKRLTKPFPLGAGQDNHVAHRDQQPQPDRQQIGPGQHRQGGEQHHLVGDRIQPGAQHAALVEQAREAAVEQIGQRGSDEQPEGAVNIVQVQMPGHERGQDQARDGEQVGQGEQGRSIGFAA